jgi:hypothetical protein
VLLKIALKLPVLGKKVPLPKGLPFLLEAPARRSERETKAVVITAAAKNNGENFLEIMGKSHLPATTMSIRKNLLGTAAVPLE